MFKHFVKRILSHVVNNASSEDIALVVQDSQQRVVHHVDFREHEGVIIKSSFNVDLGSTADWNWLSFEIFLVVRVKQHFTSFGLAVLLQFFIVSL